MAINYGYGNPGWGWSQSDPNKSIGSFQKKGFDLSMLTNPFEAFSKMNARQQEATQSILLNSIDMGTQFSNIGILGQLGRHNAKAIMANMGVIAFNEEQQLYNLKRKEALLKGDIRQYYAASNVSPSTGSALNFTVGAARNAARLEAGIEFQAQVQRKMTSYRASLAKYEAKMKQRQAMMKMIGSAVSIGVSVGMGGFGGTTQPIGQEVASWSEMMKH